MVAMRSELVEFVNLQESIMKGHDAKKGPNGWKADTVQALTSRLAEEFGEVLAHLFGQDPVCDHLIASIRDHIEESEVDLDYDPEKFRKELADVANFCMMLHDIAGKINPRRSGQSVA
jgi:NTP pyrophosphatase (non-canonical NTP hydrolase)